MHIEWGRLPRPHGVEHVPYARRFMNIQERFYLEGTPSNCSTFRGRTLPKWVYGQEIVIDIKEGEIPDIIPSSGSFVSKRARQVFEKYDTFGHQFLPVDLIDKEGIPIGEQPYYTMIVRRQISIDGRISDLNLRRDGYYAYGNYCEEDVIQQLVYIENQPELKSFLDTLPLWQLKGSNLEFFVSQQLYDALKAAKVTGIEQYTGIDSEHTAVVI